MREAIQKLIGEFIRDVCELPDRTSPNDWLEAARLLAARECPPDLIEWGRIHGIPTFAEVTWQAGFLAGMRAAMLEEPADAE